MFEKIFSYVPSWEGLRIIGKSKVVGLTILIPFIGYLLLFNETIISNLTISQNILGIKQTTEITISRLYYLYFGLTFLGTSSILFALLCPSEIKQHPSEHDYISNEIGVMTNSRLSAIGRYYASILKEGSNLHKELVNYSTAYTSADTKAERVYSGQPDRIIKYAREIENSAKLDILNFNWRYKNSSKLLVRLSILLGYLIGFILILIPSAIVFFKISVNLLDKI